MKKKSHKSSFKAKKKRVYTFSRKTIFKNYEQSIRDLNFDLRNFIDACLKLESVSDFDGLVRDILHFSDSLEGRDVTRKMMKEKIEDSITAADTIMADIDELLRILRSSYLKTMYDMVDDLSSVEDRGGENDDSDNDTDDV